ncbi:PREDICTED: inducible metalloproteinase inhibitor protein-like [Cyphomyrmex costatus]|uniref:inducible metalloproteinase inhibitor protein-like n=1 Tax=Cyphomyrmex costatus TaxID=456900 RepID=UPI00085244E4|nr:PREDICTED: inducible metalloproteinase inhibitor protein-like [Cyphomyrmex costatus]
MSRIMIILFIGLTVFVADVMLVVCSGQHEEWRCGRSCDTTCDNLYEPCSNPPKCGCYCRNGYVREENYWDRCIEIEEC